MTLRTIVLTETVTVVRHHVVTACDAQDAMRLVEAARTPHVGLRESAKHRIIAARRDDPKTTWSWIEVPHA